MDDEARRQALIGRIGEVTEGWRGLVADVGPDRAEQLGAIGDWTFKDVAAHLDAWRRRTVDRLEAAGRGEAAPPPPWQAELGPNEVEDDPINDWIHARTKDDPLAEVLARAERTYDDFLAAVEALPLRDVVDPVRFNWLGGQALADADFSGHLDEHEPSVRRWLAGA